MPFYALCTGAQRALLNIEYLTSVKYLVIEIWSVVPPHLVKSTYVVGGMYVYVFAMIYGTVTNLNAYLSKK